MTLYLETMTISPFAKIENILARSPFSEFMPCPGCGELIRYRYERHYNDSSPKMIIECPDCGVFSVVHGKSEGGRSIHKVLETGSEYNIEMRVDAVKAKLNGLGDECTICERARLTAELAWESKVSGDPLSRIWSESVGLFRDAISAGEDVRSDLTEAILRFIPMTGKEVRGITARAAKMLIDLSDAPSTARECAVWLWYVRHDVDSPEPETEFEDDLETWDVAKDAFLAMSDEEKKNAPRLASLMDLWESDLADYMDDPDGLGADDRCSILVRSAMEKLFDSLEAGVPLDPAHFDMLLYNVELMTTVEESEDVLDFLLENKGLFGGNADIVESFAEMVRIQMGLCGNALAFDLLLSGIQNEPKRKQVLAIEDVLKSLEEHVSLEFAGRTMIQAYLLYGFMVGEKGCILYAEKCAQNLSYRHQDYGGFYHDIYVFAERQGFHRSEDERSSRRNSRKDRVKRNKDVRKAHAERRRAEEGSRR